MSRNKNPQTLSFFDFKPSSAKIFLNRLLRPLNLRLDTLTADQEEQRRLLQLEQNGQFTKQVFPISLAFQAAAVEKLFEQISLFESRFRDLALASTNDVGYSFGNDYYSSPDAEVLYTIIRTTKPCTIIEVGSGHSTKIMRQAISDAGQSTHLVSIDPHPRTEIQSLVDTSYMQPVETLDIKLFEDLIPGDILFIDSSHLIKTGNDVVFLYDVVLPILRPGVVIHIHDIFLPYDYPSKWVIERGYSWNEQYLVHALLMFSEKFEVVWSGHFLQRTRDDFASAFPNLQGRLAQSLWLRKT